MSIDDNAFVAASQRYAHLFLSPDTFRRFLESYLREAQSHTSGQPDERTEDNVGYLMIATIANNLSRGDWETEWLEWYKPSAWLGSHRAAAAFLSEKLMAPKRESGWRPIETAPKDTRIWCFDGERKFEPVFIAILDGNLCNVARVDGVVMSRQPTHWQPYLKPAAPMTTQTGDAWP